MKAYLICMGVLFLTVFGYHTFILNFPLIHALVVSVLCTAVVNIIVGTIYVIIILVSACFEREVEEMVEMMEIQPNNPNGRNIVVIQNPNHISIGIACEQKADGRMGPE